jgi:hypothetical protein
LLLFSRAWLSLPRDAGEPGIVEAGMSQLENAAVFGSFSSLLICHFEKGFGFRYS